MGQEWVLIIGDLGIPEFASSLSPIFEDLIKNLKRVKEKKIIACTGNLGTSGYLFIRFLKSLVDDDVNSIYLLNDILPSTLSEASTDIEGVTEKDCCIFESNGVTFGMISAYHIKNLQLPFDSDIDKLTCPSMTSILKTRCDIIICNDQATPMVSQTVDGCVCLCAGSATGVNHFNEPEIGLELNPFQTTPKQILSMSDEEEAVADSLSSMTEVGKPTTAKNCVPADIITGNETLDLLSLDAIDQGCASQTNERQKDSASAILPSHQPPRASFMLVSITEFDVVVYNYSLMDGDLQVNQVNLQHPRSAASKETSSHK